MMTTTEFELTDEDDRVVQWRVESLERAGYAPQDVLAMAVDPQVDLHRAADLIRQGCPHELALRILL